MHRTFIISRRTCLLSVGKKVVDTGSISLWKFYFYFFSSRNLIVSFEKLLCESKWKNFDLNRKQAIVYVRKLMPEKNIRPAEHPKLEINPFICYDPEGYGNDGSRRAAGCKTFLVNDTSESAVLNEKPVEKVKKSCNFLSTFPSTVIGKKISRNTRGESAVAYLSIFLDNLRFHVCLLAVAYTVINLMGRNFRRWCNIFAVRCKIPDPRITRIVTVRQRTRRGYR